MLWIWLQGFCDESYFIFKWRKDAAEVMHIIVVLFFLFCTLLLPAPEYDPFSFVHAEDYEVISTLVVY